MDFPEKDKLRYLRANLARGRVFWFRATLLDDPKLSTREKFAVVLSCSIENDEVLFVYATSQAQEYKTGPFSAEVLVCPAGSYNCFGKETVIPVRNVKTMTVQDLAALSFPTDFKILEFLTESDMKKIDKILTASRSIELRVKRRCLPGAIRS